MSAETSLPHFQDNCSSFVFVTAERSPTNHILKSLKFREKASPKTRLESYFSSVWRIGNKFWEELFNYTTRALVFFLPFFTRNGH